MAVTAQRSILFLTAGSADGTHRSDSSNDNHQRLPLAFQRAGWAVTVCPGDTLALDAEGLSCAAGPLLQFERIWALGFGTAVSFFDRMQMLFNLPAERFVTSPVALLTLHGKFRWLEYMPETHISNDPQHLLARTGQGGEWVLKPPAGSFGRDVKRLHGQPLGSIRNEAARTPNRELLAAATRGGRYAVLQRYVPEIADGETRVLTAAGQLIGQYLRVPAAPGDSEASLPLANRSAGATARAVSLSREQAFIAGRIANDLLALGVGFAAIDLVGEQLLEVNIANPGGLQRLSELKGGGPAGDPAQRVVAALCEIWED